VPTGVPHKLASPRGRTGDLRAGIAWSKWTAVEDVPEEPVALLALGNRAGTVTLWAAPACVAHPAGAEAAAELRAAASRVRHVATVDVGAATWVTEVAFAAPEATGAVPLAVALADGRCIVVRVRRVRRSGDGYAADVDAAEPVPLPPGIGLLQQLAWLETPVC